MSKNIQLELAWDFVNKTDRSIFLTGKAGTGKTTFLHTIKAESLKRLVVVAPTGVAAINAKGVTIHSFFQLPFGPILPEESLLKAATKETNFQRKFSKNKIDVIRSLDLLIIDEISMVRADLLDGIDQVLRRYKDRNKVFGGVQVLMIGDLQQLAPVVKDNEWQLLSPYYTTPYFFSSKAFKQCNVINIELKHIYRQDNLKFIKILNEIRNNKLSQKSADDLNARYLPDFKPGKDDGFITLTTHNNRANDMNLEELKKIKSKSFTFKAEVEGKFPEYSFPTHEKLELKVGAQVMFIKNDSSHEKRYFNGKIGKIISLSKGEAIVSCPEDDEDIVTTAETWENVNYSINQDTKEISEHITGSFSQIPLRLAWAITIHKSQGLTFEKAIIDAKASFAHGQTYVALSRCRTLEGIVLKSPINTTNIISDTRVISFNKNVEENQPNTDTLNESQKIFQLNLIKELFGFYAFLYPVKRLIDIYYNNKTSLQGHIIEPLTHIKDEGITKLLQISNSFGIQLKNLCEDILEPEKDSVIRERIKKALVYFIKFTEENIKIPLDKLTYSTENKAVEKDFKKQLQLLDEHLTNKLFCLYGLKEGFTTTKYLELRAKAILQKSKAAPVKKEYTATTKHPVLFTALRGLRAAFAEELDVEHYHIFNQKSLYEMCKLLPTTPKQLHAINGMGKIRVQKYGDKILEAIQRYCEQNDIEPQEDATENTAPKKGETHLISFQFFKDGLTIEEIAKKRGLVSGTIETHLIEFVVTGELKITDLMPKEKYLELKKLIKGTPFESISELKNKIDDKFTYNEIRMVNRENTDR
ncbi:MAG: helix-turn-helix domain-containing protein [Bacteroidetes bacterium]|nr:helix-turn-helix domain-containing protein [Bacteroidota bacterium]